MLQGKTPLLIALVLGLLAALISASAITSAERRVRDGWDPVKVLCAAVDVTEGDELGEESVKTCDMPSKVVTDSFIRQDGEADNVSQVIGQRVLVPLKAGDPILYSHFESQRDFALSEAIPTKGRAIAVEVEEKAAVAQWIRPNDHVDVIGSFRDPETNEMVTVTLLENLIVLATGKLTGMTVYATEEDKKYSHVVLLTLPQEAEILTLGQETGTLTLTLRNPRDLERNEERKGKTDAKSLLTGEQSELFKKRASTFQSTTIDIIRGGSRSRESGAGTAEVPTTP
jgi:pilus assembly protein CpaB